MCKVTSQALREHKANNWPVKVFRKPQSMISEGHEKFSANRTCSGVCRVPGLRYLCRIKVEDDYKQTKSEVETRNGNGRIDKSKCKKNTAGVACIAVCPYIRIDVYICFAILVLKYKKIDIYTIHILFGFTNIYNIPHEKTSTLLSLDIPFLTRFQHVHPH